MAALNPNHEVVRAAEDQWHKIVYILLRKFNVESVDITMEDIERLQAESHQFAVALDCRSHGKPVPTMSVRIFTMEEAERLAREEGGLPC